MGNRALNWAWSLQLPITTKFVLVALADQAADDTDSCFPGQQRLANMVGGSVKTVERAVIHLEELGLIERRQRRTKQGWRTSDLYVVHVGAALPDSLPGRQVDDQDLPDSPPTRHPVQTNPTLRPDLPDSLTGQEELRSSEPLVNPKGEPSVPRSIETFELLEPPIETAPAKEPTDSELFAQWWDEYPRKVSKPAAEKAFKAALRKVGGKRSEAAAYLTGTIREHRRHWIDLAGRAIEKIPYPATWLNNEAWADELPPDEAYRSRSTETTRESPTDRIRNQRDTARAALDQIAEGATHGNAARMSRPALHALPRR